MVAKQYLNWKYSKSILSICIHHLAKKSTIVFSLSRIKVINAVLVFDLSLLACAASVRHSLLASQVHFEKEELNSSADRGELSRALA